MYRQFTGNDSWDFTSEAKSVLVTADNTWGGGTLTFSYYDNEFGGYRPLAQWTSDVQKEIVVGRNTPCRLALTGATGPALDVTYKAILD